MAARPKVIKTKSATGDLNERKPVALDNARARQSEVQRLVKEEMNRLGSAAGDDAYANVEAAHPDLFTHMTPKYLQQGDAAA